MGSRCRSSRGRRHRTRTGTRAAEPVLRNAFTTNATIEVIGVMLESVFGLSYQLDELLGFMRAMDQYRGGKGSDRRTKPTLGDGDDDGQSLDTGAALPSQAGGLGGRWHPARHARRSARSQRGREDGFIDRFLLVRPDVEPQRWTEAEADPGLLTAVATELRGLYARIPAPDGRRHWTVLLSTDAKVLWAEWYDNNVARINASAGLRAGISCRSRWRGLP